MVTDLNITGKPAQFGRGVMQDVSDKLLGQFVACLEKKLGAPADEPVQDAAAPAVRSWPTTRPAWPRRRPRPAATPRSATSPSSASRPVSTIGTASRPAAGAASATGLRRRRDALDLGATVLPILVKAYWSEGLIGVLGSCCWSSRCAAGSTDHRRHRGR